MKRRPPSDDDGEGGLDSLLDTMTNVVGILVMVLIAAQLGVKDAVDRIADSDVVDPVAIEAARETLLLTKDQRDAIQLQLDDAKPVDDSAIKVKLVDLRRQLDEVGIYLTTNSLPDDEYSDVLETDKVIEQHGVTIMIDKKSYIFLAGTKLDYSGGLNGKGFVFSNPNAKTTCGCGTSFSV